MNASRVTSFIVDSLDYFAAHTDNGDLRFGLVGVAGFQITAAHAAAHEVLACRNSDDVEEIFDRFSSGEFGSI